MIYHTIWVSIHSLKCFKTVWSGLFTSTHCSRLVASYRLDRNGRLLKFLRIPITVVYFKDRNWLSKTVNCISCLVVCKIVFCSEFPDIPDNAGKGRRRRRGRRRRQAIAKRYVFQANTKNRIITKMQLFINRFQVFPFWFYVQGQGNRKANSNKKLPEHFKFSIATSVPNQFTRFEYTHSNEKRLTLSYIKKQRKNMSKFVRTL